MWEKIKSAVCGFIARLTRRFHLNAYTDKVLAELDAEHLKSRLNAIQKEINELAEESGLNETARRLTEFMKSIDDPDKSQEVMDSLKERFKAIARKR